MRIYLACTVRGDRAGAVAGRAIAERLQRHGHEVLTLHLLADSVEAAESQLTEEEVYRRDIEWLSTCDALVAEASGSSYGVGFEVGYVLGRSTISGQRVVLLYDQARRGAVSREQRRMKGAMPQGWPRMKGAMSRPWLRTTRAVILP